MLGTATAAPMFCSSLPLSWRHMNCSIVQVKAINKSDTATVNVKSCILIYILFQLLCDFISDILATYLLVESIVVCR